MRLNISSVVGGPAAITQDLGVIVCDAYGDSWKQERLVLDFEGIRTVTPSFLSNALRPILYENGEDDPQLFVELVNVPKDFEFVWSLVRRAAIVKRGRKN